MPIILWTLPLAAMISSCSSNDSNSNTGDSILEPSYAQNFWPNETTTSTTSNKIVSEVLNSDLNADGVAEMVFLSEFPNSSNQEKSILRITESRTFFEISNFDSNRNYFHKKSQPFAIDLNQDGLKELIFLSYSRDTVYAIEFLNSKMESPFIRWSKDLPSIPTESIFRFSFDNEPIRFVIGNFGFYEKNGQPKFTALDQSNNSENDDDDDDDEDD